MRRLCARSGPFGQASCPASCHPCPRSDLLPVSPVRAPRIHLTAFRALAFEARRSILNRAALGPEPAATDESRPGPESSRRAPCRAPAVHTRAARRLMVRRVLPPRLSLAAEIAHELVFVVASLGPRPAPRPRQDRKSVV